LFSFTVTPECERERCGVGVMVKAMENMRERGVESMCIDSVSIRGFYEKLGFETFWEYERYVW
jgi:beta-N-acetylhexosaminidase